MKLALWISSLLLCFLISPTWAQDPKADDIDAAIKRGREFLMKIRTADKHWDPPFPAGDWAVNHPGGRTALTVLALISTGDSASSESVSKAVEALRTWKTDSTYVIGVRASLFSQLAQNPENRQVCFYDLSLIKNAYVKNGKLVGLYGYFPPPVNINKARPDHPHFSTSNYGVLGAWALADAGYELPPEYWQTMDNAWRNWQRKSGAWGYRPEPGPDDNPEHRDSMSMTTAGIASLLISSDFMVREVKGNPQDIRIEAGLKWIDTNWDKISQQYGTNGPFMDCYSLYNIERLGVASGLRRIGPRDWYAVGSKMLLGLQNKDGSWKRLPTSAAVDTSFALLFLSHGKAPVMMNKLQYNVLDPKTKQPALANWNQRPRDAANLVLWAKRQLERDLRWQIIDLNATTGELLEAPILYLAGDQALTFTDAEVSRMRDFCEAGGIILGCPDRGNKDFNDSFRKLGSRLFSKYEFRRLPENHYIFTGESSKASTWKKQISVEGLSNGAREMMLLIPEGDLGKYWSSRMSSTRPETFQLAANIYLYSIGKSGAWERGRGYYLPPVASPAGDPRKVVRIEYSGNWNPEPYGWKRLQAILAGSNKTALTIDSVKLGEGKLKGVKLAHLTGTAEVRFTQAQRDELKSFVNDGGTLLVDSCGGSDEFGASLMLEMHQIFGNDAKALDDELKIASPVFEKWGPKISKLNFRDYSIAKGRISTGGVGLRAMEIKGRPAVIFSYQDLSTGLTGAPTDAVDGFTPASAVDVVRNIVLNCGK